MPTGNFSTFTMHNSLRTSSIDTVFETEEKILRKETMTRPGTRNIFHDALQFDFLNAKRHSRILEDNEAQVPLIKANRNKHTMEISLLASFFFLLLFVLFIFRRNLLSLFNGGKNGFGDEEDFATTMNEYDELLQDTFNDDDFTDDGSSDESITSILSEWSEDAGSMSFEMSSLKSSKSKAKK